MRIFSSVIISLIIITLGILTFNESIPSIIIGFSIILIGLIFLLFFIGLYLHIEFFVKKKLSSNIINIKSSNLSTDKLLDLVKSLKGIKDNRCKIKMYYDKEEGNVVEITIKNLNKKEYNSFIKIIDEKTKKLGIDYFIIG